MSQTRFERRSEHKRRTEMKGKAYVQDNLSVAKALRKFWEKDKEGRGKEEGEKR